MTSKVCLSCHPFSCSYNISVITSAYHIPCNVDWRQIWVLMYSEVIILIKCYSDVSHIHGICFNLSYLVGVDVFSPLWNMQNAEIKYCKYVRLICKSPYKVPKFSQPSILCLTAACSKCLGNIEQDKLAVYISWGILLSFSKL